jgi:hypothetical protein
MFKMVCCSRKAKHHQCLCVPVVELQAAGTEDKYRFLLAKLCCNIEAEDCMLSHCKLCPGA